MATLNELINKATGLTADYEALLNDENVSVEEKAKIYEILEWCIPGGAYLDNEEKQKAANDLIVAAADEAGVDLDVNADGKVDEADVKAVKDNIGVEVTEENAKLDVNKDKKIDEKDVNLVNKTAEVQAVAKIKDVKYATLADAFNAAKSGDTVEVLADCTGAGLFLGEDDAKTVTVNFNNHKFTCDTPVGSTGTVNQAMHFEMGNTVTLKNGTVAVVENSEAAFRFILQNYANVTLNNMVFDGANLNHTKAHFVLSNNFGNVKVTGKTNIIAKEGDNAFDVYYYNNHPTPEKYTAGVKVTFDNKFTGVVVGKVEYGSGTNPDEGWQEKTLLTVMAGDFSKAVLVTEAENAGITVAANVKADASWDAYKPVSEAEVN